MLGSLIMFAMFLVAMNRYEELQEEAEASRPGA
jgi:hypothetical protein